VVVLTEDFFRSYRGKKQQFVMVVELPGGEQSQAVSLTPSDFSTTEGLLPGLADTDGTAKITRKQRRREKRSLTFLSSH
jgi:hypothetical protein